MIRVMLLSMVSTLTGRFSSARVSPRRSLFSSNGSREPSRLTMRGMTSSAVSNVVKRSPQVRHSRRRRTDSPSATSRESMTLVSSAPQNGQCTVLPPGQAARAP